MYPDGSSFSCLIGSSLKNASCVPCSQLSLLPNDLLGEGNEAVGGTGFERSDGAGLASTQEGALLI